MRDKDLGDWEAEDEILMERQSVETILKMADWASFDKNSCWYTEVGIALQTAGHDEVAAEYYKRALEEDSTMLVPKEGLAMCLHSQEYFFSAANQLRETIGQLTADDEALPGQSLRLAELELAADRAEACALSVETAFDFAIRNVDKPDFDLCTECIELLDKAKQSDMVVKLLKRLDDLSSSPGITLLDRFLTMIGEVHGEIGRACRREGKPAFVASALNRAWVRLSESSSNNGRTAYLAGSAVFALSAYFDENDKAMERMERVIELFDQLDSSQDITLARLAAVFKAFVVVAYFDAAVAAQPDPVSFFA